MKKYVIDTIALVRYFEDDLPPKANLAFENAEKGKAVLLLPSIVVGEFCYVALKGRLKTEDPLATISELLYDVEIATFIEPVDMRSLDWKAFLRLKIPELHDRMICAIAVARGADGLITNDIEIRNAGVSTIWD